MAIVSFGQENNRPRGINDRQEAQRNRIKDGVKDGDISKRELGRLAHEQAQIGRLERRLKTSDDDFTKVERARVQRQLNQSNRHIRRASRP